MDDAKALWSQWQSLLRPFQARFTSGGWVRFCQWVTGMVLCDEEHTITQILTSMQLESRWRVMEHFAEYGSWNLTAVERQLMQVVEQQQPKRWGPYRVVAVDDTKLHRSSASVWGTCTFHEPAARCPNRAETVRAHNWVVAGDLLPGRPWTYLPHSARLYLRKSQLPPGESFRPKTAMAVEMLRAVNEESQAPVLAVFDGAYAKQSVIRSLLAPGHGGRRIGFVTRLRKDARLYHPLPPGDPNPKGGRPRKWGPRMAAPQHHEKWNVAWNHGQAFLYGRVRSFRYKHVLCQWSVSGPEHLVHAYVFEVEGYEEPWFLASDTELEPSPVVEVFAARFRQENGFRDHKQRLGMEECRAWTKAPVLRTFQVQMVAQTLLRLMQFHLDATQGEQSWWQPPDWNRRKRHPSLLDLRRLFWRYRLRFSQCLRRLEDMAKPPQAHFPCRRSLRMAA